MNDAVRVTDLVVRRGNVRAVDDVSLVVASGRVTGLLGPSGSGKTTLLRSIVGVQRVTSGAVEVLGLPAGSAELRCRVAYMTQAPSVYPDLSIDENLRFFQRALKAPSQRVAVVLDVVALSERAGQVVGTLSGGERARVSLAIALLADPDVLVLDEPTVGLDPLLRMELWEMFRTLAADGRTLLVSSHVMDEADRCDDLLLMRDGALLAAGSRVSLLEQTGRRDVESAFLELVAQHRTS